MKQMRGIKRKLCGANVALYELASQATFVVILFDTKQQSAPLIPQNLMAVQINSNLGGVLYHSLNEKHILAAT